MRRSLQVKTRQAVGTLVCLAVLSHVSLLPACGGGPAGPGPGDEHAARARAAPRESGVLLAPAAPSTSRRNEPRVESGVSLAEVPPGVPNCDGVPVPVGGFAMSVYEVSVAEYLRCAASGACPAIPDEPYCNTSREGVADHPVNCVDWAQADAYCSWSGGRLPTVAEWQYAARGSSNSRYPWGDEPMSESHLTGRCAGCGTLPSAGRERSSSPWGIRDMIGNVAEWTSTSYGAGCATNPTRPTSDDDVYVYAGCGWSCDPFAADLRRDDGAPVTFASRDLGIRCVYSLSADES